MADEVRLATVPRRAGGGNPLLSELFAPQRAADQQRGRFGRALSLDRIETALRQAQSGLMRDITDLSRETVDTDPHLAAVLGKRLRAVSSLQYEVQPAQGPNVDPERAEFYAAVVRDQLAAMDGLRGTLGRLAWALFDGRACEELVWAEVPGAAPSAFGTPTMQVVQTAWVHPRRLTFGPRRELRVVGDGQQLGAGFSEVGVAVEDVPFKFCWWMPQLFGDYQEREGLAMRCLYWSFFKRFAARERMILAELFGKPWRWIEVTENFAGSPEDLQAADQIVDALGGTYTARLPRGVKLHVERPDTDGEIHAAIVRDTDAQISKLVLGQGGTTEGVSAGLNSSQAQVMSEEQAAILVTDARLLAEVVEDRLTDAIIAVNFGVEALPHAPRFVLSTATPADAAKEAARLKAALEVGLPVTREEAYQAVGFRVPVEDEALVGDDGAAPAPTAPAPSTEPEPEGDPAAAAPEPSAVALPVQQQALNGAQVTSLLEVIRSAAAGEITAESAVAIITSAFPVDESAARRMLQGARAAEPEPQAAPPPAQAEPAPQAAQDDPGSVLASAHERVLALDEQGECVRCAGDHRQLRTTNGSVEDLLERSVSESRLAMRAIVNAYKAAVDGVLDPREAHRALLRVQGEIDTRPLGRALERRMLHAAALGALDSDGGELGDSDEEDEEAERDKAAIEVGAAPVALAPRKRKPAPPSFTTMTFDRAMRLFRDKRVVQRARFDRLSAKAKQRAFTVAGVVANDALAVIQDELAQLIGTGTSLAEFGEAIERRMQDSGFVASLRPLADGSMAMRATHLETVFRTNVLGAYNAGRADHASQPLVLAKRPVWEIRSVQDTRTRDTHKVVNGTKLLARDPFWRTAYPPFGYNCRCRVISRGPEHLPDVVPGSSVEGLPDEGFTSGIGSMLSPLD